MPYVQVQPEDLQIGKEYVLTLKGVESRLEGAEYETVPIYNHGYTSPGEEPRQTGTKEQMKRPVTVVVPPTSETALLDAARALWMWQNRDRPETSYAYKVVKKSSPITIDYIRKKAFFAGVKPSNNMLVFTQERSYGSSKPVAFVPIANVDEKDRWGNSKYQGKSPNDWAFWKIQGNNQTRRNQNGNRQNRNLVLGNLLGNTRTAQQALNKTYNQHRMEQNLKGVLSGGRRRKTRRSRTY